MATRWRLSNRKLISSTISCWMPSGPPCLRISPSHQQHKVTSVHRRGEGVWGDAGWNWCNVWPVSSLAVPPGIQGFPGQPPQQQSLLGYPPGIRPPMPGFPGTHSHALKLDAWVMTLHINKCVGWALCVVGCRRRTPLRPQPVWGRPRKLWQLQGSRRRRGRVSKTAEWQVENGNVIDVIHCSMCMGVIVCVCVQGHARGPPLHHWIQRPGRPRRPGLLLNPFIKRKPTTPQLFLLYFLQFLLFSAVVRLIVRFLGFFMFILMFHPVVVCFQF